MTLMIMAINITTIFNSKSGGKMFPFVQLDYEKYAINTIIKEFPQYIWTEYQFIANEAHR